MRMPGGAVLLAAVTFAYFIAFPLIIGRTDESHLLHGARRLLDGQVLYKDFFEIITPLAFYFIALVYRIGGTTLLAARVAMAVIEAIGCAVLFALVRQIAATLEALLATLIFACLCIPVWPYASAHWMSTTLALGTAAVLLSDRWQQSARARPGLAGLLAGIALCVQQQRGVFLLAWLFAAALPIMAAASPPGDRWKRLRTEVVFAGMGAGACIALVLGHAVWAASLASVVEHLYGFAAESYGPQYFASLPWAGVSLLTDVYAAATWRWLFQIAPLFVVGEVLVLARRLRRPWPRPLLVRASCCALAAFMALSVLYLPDFIHVSFVMPFLLIPGARLLHGVRMWPGWARIPAGAAVARAAVLAAALAVTVKGLDTLAAARSSMPGRLPTAFGTLRSNEFLAGFFAAVQRNLVPEPTGRSVVYSYPDDAWLYLTLPADDATRFDILGTNFPTRYMEQATGALRARRAGTVVVLSLMKTPPPIDAALADGYRLAEEYYPYRIYVRRAEGTS